MLVREWKGSAVNGVLLFFFISHRKKRMKQLQKKIKSGTLDLKKDDPFELFVSATNIRYCYYAETHKILGNTYGMCVLQVGMMNNFLFLKVHCHWKLLINTPFCAIHNLLLQKSITMSLYIYQINPGLQFPWVTKTEFLQTILIQH